MLHAKFVASPAGHGRDCYRTWEAFALGAVPVLRRDNGSWEDRTKFESLPIVWVNEWDEVTPQFLVARWTELLKMRHALDARRAFLPYWLGRLTADFLHKRVDAK